MSKIARANISEDKSLILLLFNSLIISYDNLNDKNLITACDSLAYACILAC